MPAALQVSYMVAPGARIGLGSQDICLMCAFEEAGSSAMAEMMMKASWRWRAGGVGGRRAGS